MTRKSIKQAAAQVPPSELKVAMEKIWAKKGAINVHGKARWTAPGGEGAWLLPIESRLDPEGKPGDDLRLDEKGS